MAAEGNGAQPGIAGGAVSLTAQLLPIAYEVVGGEGTGPDGNRKPMVCLRLMIPAGVVEVMLEANAAKSVGESLGEAAGAAASGLVVAREAPPPPPPPA